MTTKPSGTPLPPERISAIEAAVYAQRIALADLMHSLDRGQGDVASGVRQIIETAARTLEVERASFWRLVEDGTAIECTDMYELSRDRHSAGLVIRAQDAPRYFQALQNERAICANDARTDPRTSEFSAGYLEPLGICSMLDAPVFVRGRMVGVVCHEHVGATRRWKFSEELLAGTFADFVALVMETAAWHQAQEALRRERDALETKVEERTRALLDSEQSLRSLLDFSPVAMVLTRLSDHRVVYANQRAAALFELPLDRVVGQSAPDFWGNQDDRQRFLESLMRNGRVDDLEAQLRSVKGRDFWARLWAQRLRFDGEDTLLGAMVDVTDQKNTQTRLHELATQDELTGLYNRRHLEELVRRELERTRRYRRPLTLAVLDVDRFKQINDTRGHAVGDEVLRVLAVRCRKTLRSNDVLGRYGGDELVVVFPETGLEEARVVAERMRSAVRETPITVQDGQAMELTVSIGLTSFSEGDDGRTLFARADAALYAAKEAGRDRVLAG